jgi:pimeloyl-ACP methyl ester carboxylesterase
MTNARVTYRIWVLVFAIILCQAGLLAAEEKQDVVKPSAFTVKVTGSGRPMILIPGLGCGGNVWDETVARFKDRYQCHVVTLAGFAGQPAIGEPFLEQVRSGLVEYIRRNKLERPVIVGHSLGGFMAFWLGATAPDQVGPVISVDGVPFYAALMDINATPESAKPFAERMREMYKAQSPQQFAFGFRSSLAVMITDPNAVEKVGRLGSKSDPKAVGQATYELMTTDLRKQVKAIKTPVLLIGATASITDPDQRNAAQENYKLQVAQVPKHKVVFAPKARHFIQLDEPEFFFGQVESFLKDVDNAKLAE